jgi:hypothetical protein
MQTVSLNPAQRLVLLRRFQLGVRFLRSLARKACAICRVIIFPKRWIIFPERRSSFPKLGLLPENGYDPVKTHSSRSAFIGSIAAARRAGPKVAASVTTTSRAGTTTYGVRHDIVSQDIRRSRATASSREIEREEEPRICLSTQETFYNFADWRND